MDKNQKRTTAKHDESPCKLYNYQISLIILHSIILSLYDHKRLVDDKFIILLCRNIQFFMVKFLYQVHYALYEGQSLTQN